MGMGILILGSMNAFKFGVFGLFFGLLMLLFFCQIVTTGVQRVIFVMASTLFFAFLGFAEVANTALKVMG